MSTELLSRLRPGSEEQLICFPYLGGYANSFLPLLPHVHSSMEIWGITLPGHGGDTSVPLQSLAELVNLLFEPIKKIMRPNSIFMGHSMGAMVAYFLLQKMLISDPEGIQPKALILSASPVPSYFSEMPLSGLADQALLAQLQNYGGISAEILREKSLMEYFLPIYRADFKILESAATYSYTPIAFPVYYFWGEDDPIVSLKNALGWRAYFQNEMQLIPFAKASHMFIQTKAAEMVKNIQKIFSEVEHVMYSG